MNPDAVYTLLVEANPVPDEAAPRLVTVLDRLQRPELGSETMTLTTPTSTTIETPTGPPRHRWILAAAAAAVVLLGIGAFALTRDDPAPTEPADEPTPTLPAAPTPEEQAAIDVASRYQTALASGDLDTVEAMTDPEASNLVADRHMSEMRGVIADAYGAPTLTNCVARDAVAWVEVRCDETTADPVALELGVTDLVTPTKVFDDGTAAWLPWEGADVGAVNRATSDYLQAFHPAEFEAACLPGAYELGTIHQSANLALTGACAELWVPLGDDIARWIRDGRPDPTG